jgi:trk system potassium uptake protein TrkH
MSIVSKLNFKLIFHFMGLLLLFNGVSMLVASLVSLYYNDGAFSGIILSALITMGIGFVVFLLTRKHKKEIKKRAGYVIVTFGWLIMAFSGTLPYLITGAIPEFTNALFETMSGYTTTGATILNDIEILPESILFWRSLTHWIGGMGIIVLAIAILPLLGIGGMQLFAAESPGPNTDKLHPRITDTAKRLWLLYFGYTIIETILLNLAGMSLFDAVNHSMSTLASGGFSTKNDSLAHWNDTPAIQYIVMVFMFLAGTNFILSYFAFKGRFSKIFKDEEFRLYVSFILIFSLITAGVIYFQGDLSESVLSHAAVFGEAEEAVRMALFQVIAIITTTGFVVVDYTSVTPFLTMFFFGMMFLGGSARSTSGGMKIVRHLITIKNGIMEFKRSFHSNAVLPVRYNQRAVPQAIVFNVMAFFILYILMFIIGVSVFAWLGLDFQTALGSSASMLGNVGPAIGNVGPVNNYDILPDIGKLWAAFLMLVGRLELFTVLILLTPFFWRNR